jgi:hypothetical protein
LRPAFPMDLLVRTPEKVQQIEMGKLIHARNPRPGQGAHKPTTAEWVAKAEDDFAVMVREGQVVVHPSYDAVCFHAQQCRDRRHCPDMTVLYCRKIICKFCRRQAKVAIHLTALERSHVRRLRSAAKTLKFGAGLVHFGALSCIVCKGCCVVPNASCKEARRGV